MTPSKILRKYRKRAVAILAEVQDLLRREDYAVSDPWFFPNDETPTYALSIDADPDNGRDESVEIFFEFLFSEKFDGEKGGVNFSINVASEEGTVIGGLCPGNYSSNVWVPRKNAEAVEARFRLLEKLDPAALVNSIQEWEMSLEPPPAAPKSPSQPEQPQP
jgi:hypothetical protein